MLSRASRCLQLSIAHAFNLFTIPLCLFASLGIVVGSIIRAYGGLGAGILFNLGLVLPIVGGQFISSYASTWHLVGPRGPDIACTPLNLKGP